MTYNNFYTLFGAALEETDQERYLSEWSSSTIFYPDPDEDGADPEQVVQVLDNIWGVAHMTVADIRATTGLTQAKFAERFCIPKRTLENWEMRGSCPDYTRLMMAEVLGLLRVERGN